MVFKKLGKEPPSGTQFSAIGGIIKEAVETQERSRTRLCWRPPLCAERAGCDALQKCAATVRLSPWAEELGTEEIRSGLPHH